MDIIQSAIEKKQHISQRKGLNEQSWQKFIEASCDKKVFLFGVSTCANYFFYNYRDVPLEGIIDNDIRKQGFRADDFLSGAVEHPYGNLMISMKDVLAGYSLNEIVVLIASTNHYEEIIDQLEEMNIRQYFVLLIMEADKRIKEKKEPQSIETLCSRSDYAVQCCKEEINRNKIVFFAFGSYSDHGKYITEALLQINKGLDIVWLLHNLYTEVPEGVRKVYVSNWKRYIYELETARIWIYNMMLPDYVIKRPEQVYIQTKHWASITLKKFYLDASTVQNVPELIENWKYNGKIMDYIITGSDFDTESCRRGFDFHKDVWQIGSPRSDALFKEKELKKKIYEFYGIGSDMHLLLYAPTYRFDKTSVEYQHESRGVNLDFKSVKVALEKRFGGEWCIMLRLHPSVAKEGDKLIKDEFVINSGDYEDSEELSSACDIMISDYSSIMFEPAFVRKPVFLFAVDRKEYIDKEYDLLIEYDTLPFPIAESNDELIQKIERFDQEEYERRLQDFMDKYGIQEDGHASERAASLIQAIIDEK